MKRKVTLRNLDAVLQRYRDFIIESPKDSLKELNAFFDELRDNDVFGTEGQLDPRGDNRE